MIQDGGHRIGMLHQRKFDQGGLPLDLNALVLRSSSKSLVRLRLRNKQKVLVCVIDILELESEDAFPGSFGNETTNMGERLPLALL